MICSCSRIYNSLLVCYTCQWRGQWKRGRWTELKKVRPTLSGLTGSLTYLIALVSCESVMSYQMGHQGRYTRELKHDLELILQRRNDWIARSLIASMTFQGRVEILVASCYRNLSNLWTNGPLDSCADLFNTLQVLSCFNLVIGTWFENIFMLSLFAQGHLPYAKQRPTDCC